MARVSTLPLDLSEQPRGLSLSGKVAEALAREIRRGRFAPGARLPSSRKLAEQLGVHRNTVLSALSDLLDQGYIETQPARGVFVSGRIPRTPSRKKLAEERRPVDFPLSPALPRGNSDVPMSAFPLLGGLPDLRLSPSRELARAYRLALRDAVTTLDYDSERGEPRFLSTFGRFLSETRGVVVGEGELLTTRGSQQALFLAARVLCHPGKVIAVEALGYPPAWEAFRLAGARLCPVRVDKGGLVVSDLERLADRESVCAVYVTPHHQYPTTVTMSGPRRSQLLRLAKEKRFFVIEDDYDHEFHFEGRPVLPLASFDLSALVVHIGTFSKVLAPGLRLGYVAAQRRVIDAMCRVRRVLDRQGDHTMERALAYLIEDGEFAAHVRRMHRVYSERRDVLLAELARCLPDKLSFSRPGGGLAVWSRVLRGPERQESRALGHLAERWAISAREAGVVVQWGKLLSFEGRHKSHFRLGYPRLNAEEIRTAVRLLAESHPFA